MKKIRKRVLFFNLIIAACFLLAGCADITPVTKSQSITVTVIDSNKFMLAENKSIYQADECGNVEIKILTNESYYVSSVSYSGSEILEINDRLTVIRLSEVKYSIRLSVYCQEKDGSIVYHLNGGKFIDEALNTESADIYTVSYDISNHIRANTEIGTDRIKREGYTLIGWNTDANGEGRHIGLGSRVSITDKHIHLYAEWREWSPAGWFTYSMQGGSQMITGFTGDTNVDVLSIPEYINGVKVNSIQSNSFIDGNFHSVIFPKQIFSVQMNAFINCDIKEIYMYDNIMSFFEEAIVGSNEFSTVHINAILPPACVNLDRHSNLADKYDILIENKEKNKIIVYSGSSAFFSIDTKQIEEAFPEYVVINMAVNGHFNSAAQMEVITSYIEEGDIFLHAPEAAGTEQFMLRNDFSDRRLFMAFESNFDLLAEMDIRNTGNFFYGYNELNSHRIYRAAQKYTDYADYIDDRGNYSKQKPSYKYDVVLSKEATLDLAVLAALKEDSTLKSYYKRIETLGAKVVVCHAPVNRQGLEYTHGDELDMIIDTYKREYNLNISYPVLLDLEECIYNGGLFFNSDYHLSDEGTKIHTQKIIAALHKLLVMTINKYIYFG